MCFLGCCLERYLQGVAGGGRTGKRTEGAPKGIKRRVDEGGRAGVITDVRTTPATDAVSVQVATLIAVDIP